MPISRHSALALLLCLGAALAPSAIGQTEVPPPPTPGAEPTLIDRVLAVVDEEVILQSDLDREVELYYMEMRESGTEPEGDPAVVRSQIISNLVESKLIIAAAKQADLEVEPEMVLASVDERIDQLVQHFGSRDGLERELMRMGMTLDDYRERLASQMTDQQYMRSVIGRFIRPRVEVLDNEVADFYVERADELPSTPDSLTLANILVAVEPSAEARRLVQDKIVEARSALDGRESFAAVARRLSAGPNASRGGVLGVVGRGDLFDPALETAVFSLSVGEVSRPVITQRGVHLVQLDAITEAGRAISQIFFPLGISEADIEAARQRAAGIVARLDAGEDFALVASQTSGDPRSAANGGFLGRFALTDLSPQFQEALADIEAGRVTEVIETAAGFYIFQVQARSAGNRLPMDQVSEQIRRVIENQKLETELTAYVDSLRDRFFVDLKD